MSWAASRSTTRIEDRAYYLMGLSEIHMPMLYGEGERGFYRLQEEIIKQSNDMSIFCWTDTTANFSTYRGLLARSPREFEQCRDVRWDRHETSPGPEITSRGIKLNDVQLIPEPNKSNEFLIPLPGVQHNKNSKRGLGIYLQKISKTQFTRVDPDRVDYWLREDEDETEFHPDPLPSILVRQRPLLADMSVARLGGIYVDNGLKSEDSYLVTSPQNFNAISGFHFFENPGEMLKNPVVQINITQNFGHQCHFDVRCQREIGILYEYKWSPPLR